MKRITLAILFAGSFGVMSAGVLPKVPASEKSVREKVLFAMCMNRDAEFFLMLFNSSAGAAKDFPSAEKLKEIVKELKDVGCCVEKWSDIEALRAFFLSLAQDRDELEKQNKDVNLSEQLSAKEMYEIMQIFSKVDAAIKASFPDGAEKK